MDENTPHEYAKEVFVFLDKNYRVSRNIRLRWFLDRLYKPLLLCTNNQNCDNECGLHIVSVLPQQEDYGDASSNLLLSPDTGVVFISSAYRFVFGLDLSSSALRTDTLEHFVVIESMLTALENCLLSLIQTYSPTSTFKFKPDVYITIFVQWYGTQPSSLDPTQDKLMQRVLVQGCQLTKETILHIMQKVKGTIYTCINKNYSEKLQSKQDEFLLSILRTGLLALRVLPPNRRSCIVILTDGVVGEPNAANLERIIKQCQGTTTSCSFIHVCASANPLCDFGMISNVELMQFISQATKGKYINTLHIPASSLAAGTYFQHVLLPWTFFSQKLLPVDENSLAFVGSTRSCSAFDLRNIINPSVQSPALIRRKQDDRNVMGDFVTVVSARLREGFEVENIKVTKNTIEMTLVLHWSKNCTDVEYKVSSGWPLNSNRCKVEVFICGTYEFLHDVSRSRESRQWTRFRKMIMHRFMIFFQDLLQSEHMLQYLNSFADDPARYSISDSLRQGLTLYYLPPNSTHYEISSQSLHTSTAFSSYWKPILSLDVNVWHKWFHIHRIEVVLQHDVPLPDDLHIVPNDGRFHAVQCRKAFSSLIAMLRDWCTFVLLENHTYVKFINKDEGTEKPSSFFLVRLFSKSPATVLKIAFLSGLSGRVRKQLVDELCDRVAALLISVKSVSTTSTNVSRERMRHTSSKLSPIMKNQRSQPSASDVPCAVLLHKPMDQFLIRYSQPPEDYHSKVIATEAKMKVNSDMNDPYIRMRDMQWYLHHHRSVWSLTNTTLTPLQQDVAYHLASLLRKIRMEEGFRITYSASGIVNLAREFPMHSHADTAEYCLVQYVIFPPKVQTIISNHSSSSLESEDEGAMHEDIDVLPTCGKEIIFATEVWVEPQHGCIKQHNPLSSSYSSLEQSKNFAEFQNNVLNEVYHFGGLNSNDLIEHLNCHDFGCISNVITLEHLQLMCTTKNDMASVFPQNNNSSSESTKYHSSSRPFQPTHDNISGSNGRADDSFENCFRKNLNFQYNSCVFDLICLLEHSPRVEHLFFTLAQDELGCNASNSVLMANFHKYLAAFCDCSVDLSDSDQEMITHHMELKSHKSKPSGRYQSSSDGPWSCYLKSGERGQIFVLLLPSSFEAFLSLSFMFEETVAVKNQSMSFQSSEYQAGDDQKSSTLFAMNDATYTFGEQVEPLFEKAFTNKSYGTVSPKFNRRMSIKRLTSTTSNSSENLLEQLSPSVSQRTMSVFVYNCSMKMLVSSLLHGAKNTSRIKWPDSLQDHRIFVDSGSEDYVHDLHSTDTNFPKPSAGSHGLGDISEEAFPLRSSENEYLFRINNTLVDLYHRSFVVGVFSAVQSDDRLFVSTEDLEVATDYFCQESVDEIDITDFVFLNCPPVLEFRSKHLKCGSHDDSISSDETNPDLTKQLSGISLRPCKQPKRKKTDSMTATTAFNQPEDLFSAAHIESSEGSECQNGVGEKTKYLIRPTPTPGITFHEKSAFTNVRENQEYRKRNAHDSERSSSSDEETASIIAAHIANKDLSRKGTTFPAKQVIRSTNQINGLEAGWTNLPHFPISQLNGPHSRHFSGTNEQVEKHFLKLLKAYCKSVRKIPYLFYAVNQQTPSQKQVIKVEESKNESDSEVEFLCEGGNEANHSVSVHNSVGMPDSEVTTPKHSDEYDSADIFDTAGDINPLFLYMTCTIRDLRTSNVGSVPVKCLPINLKDVVDSMETKNDFIDLSKIKITLDLSWIYLPPIHHNTNDVPDECASFVHGIKQKIKWLLEDEIISSLRTTEPITTSTLNRVAQHAQLSSAFSNSKTASIPLQFIFGIERSKSLLQTEFEKLRIDNYKLKKVEQYYFLSLERTFLPILDYFNSIKNISIEEGPELILSPDAKQLLTSTSSCSPKAGQLKAMCDSQVLIHDISRSLLENDRSSGSCADLGQHDKVTKTSKLTKASSSTELVLGSSSIVRRCTSASNMPSGLTNSKSLGHAYSQPFSQETSSPSMITPPPMLNHQVLRASLSLGKDSKYCSPLASHRGRVVSMPVTPSNMNTDAPVFVYPVNKIDSRQNVGVSPASDSSYHQYSQTSWFGSGYEGEESDSEDELNPGNSLLEAYSQLPNFWLIVYMKNDVATVYFHRRSSTKVVPAVKKEHDRIFNVVLSNLKKSSKAVNQILLLKKLHDSLCCHPLLVEEAPEHIWGKDDYSSIYHHADHVEDQGDEEMQKLNHGSDYLAATMNFPQGSFECNCVLEQTIVLHHRIAVSKSSGGGTVPSALSTVKAFMKNFTVINQKNMFVFQVQDGTVYYCKMLEETKRPDSCGRRSSLLTDTEHLQHGRDYQRHQEPEAKLHLKWYGVHALTEQQQIDLDELKTGIEKRLDDTVLEYITLMLCRNTHFKLTATDVCLIQPREESSKGLAVPISPDETISFAVSAKLIDSMPALLYYIHQHLLLFLSIPKYSNSNTAHFLPIFSRNGGKVSPSFESSALYLYAESTEKGKKGHGIACICLDYSIHKGNDDPCSSEANTDITAALLEELATVSSIDDVKPCDENNAVISVFIWKRGCLSSNALHEKLEIAVRHAVCDAVTEHYLKLPLAPQNDTKTTVMKSLSFEKEESRFLPSFLQPKFGSSATRLAKKDLPEHDDSSISPGTLLNSFYSNVLPSWLKHMLNKSCPSVVHDSLEFHGHMNKEQIVLNVCKILHQYLRNSQILRFYKTSSSNKEWIYTNSENGDVGKPGNYLQCIVLSRNYGLWKKSSTSALIKTHSSWVSLQKFPPHDVTLQPEASPCPQHDMMMSSSYIPRQHFVYVTTKLGSIDVFFYNVAHDKAHSAFKQLKQCLKFQTARLVMLQGLTFQKLGLFKHCLTKSPTSNQIGTDLASYSVDTLSRYPHLPHLERKQQKFSYVDKCFDEFLLNFSQVDNASATDSCSQVKDKVAHYGQQCIARLKEKSVIKEVQNQLKNLRRKVSGSICSLSKSELRTVLSYARIMHVVTSPIMLDNASCQSYVSFFQPTESLKQKNGRADKTSTVLSRTSSFLGSYRKKSGESLNKMPDRDLSLSAKDVENRFAEMSFKFIADKFVELYCDHWKTFVKVQVGSDFKLSKQDQNGEDSEVSEHYCYRFIQGGIILIGFSVHHFYFQVKLYAIPSFLFSDQSNFYFKKTHTNFVSECEKVKENLDVHRIALDVHLRYLRWYVNEPQYTVKAECNLRDLLNFLIKAYSPLLANIQSQIYHSMVSHTCSQVSNQDLYKFIVSNASAFKLQTFVQKDNSDVNENVLFSTEKIDVQMKGFSSALPDKSEFCQFIFKDDEQESNSLKFHYYLLFVVNHRESLSSTNRLPEVLKQAQATLSRKLSEVSGSSSERLSPASPIKYSPAEEDVKLEGGSIPYVMCGMKNIENSLREITFTATVECYRSCYLWHKLVQLCQEKAYGKTLTYTEFCTLLDMMQRASVQEHDAKILNILRKRNIKCDEFVIKRLLKQFSKMSTVITSPDHAMQHLCILSPRNIHVMIILETNSTSHDFDVVIVKPLAEHMIFHQDSAEDVCNELLQKVCNAIFTSVWMSWL